MNDKSDKQPRHSRETVLDATSLPTLVRDYNQCLFQLSARAAHCTLEEMDRDFSALIALLELIETLVEEINHP